ncbi:MAG TPA: hypothetical protein DET40_19285 [Lentisphaeria bacterium]|nr:MAG: hypothetical protein A2X45_18115 [Lentisphaerae bacterium GWF2_50_93]HCE45692.1 hypothetical protein [Lentisphaeria bacterium]
MDGFNNRLANLRRWWQLGLLLRDLVGTIIYAVMIFLAYAMFDYFFAFESDTRAAVGIILLLVLVSKALFLAVRALRLKDRDMAVRADIILGRSNRPVLSALELGNWLGNSKQALPGFAVFLAEQGIQKAEKELGAISVFKCLPLSGIWKNMGILTALASCLLMVFLFAGDTLKTLSARVFFPYWDVPPCSSYVFSVDPQEPRILYGGDQAVSVRITGAPVEAQVWFITRYNGKTYRTSCFRDNESRYTQRLEKVVYPLEFCFAAGKARSRWHRIDLLYQPVIAVASVRITAPAYSGLPRKQFFAGNDELSGLKNSNVELSVTSNRELLDGRLILRPAGNPSAEETIPAVKTGKSTLNFNWSIKEPAEVEVVIRDIRGTCNKDRYILSQKTVPDRPPELSISNPPVFSLATPGSSMPLSGSASDDLGLQKVEIVKAVVGYRDRMKHLGPDAQARSFRFDDKLELKDIGVLPGQTLEFYMEAADGNPDLTGIASSEIVRVQIISEEEYALMLRVRTGLEDFVRRYRVISDEIRNLRKNLQELADKAAASPGKTAELAALLEKAVESSKHAADLFEKMAMDFPLYDIEKEFMKSLKDSSDKFRNIGVSLENLKPGTPDFAQKARMLSSQFEQAAEPVEEQIRDAGEIELVARLLECRIRFEKITAAQETMVRRLQRLESETRFRDLKMLALLGQRQGELRKELLKILGDIEGSSAKLPSGYDKLKYGSLEFMDKVNELEIPALMLKAADAAKNTEGKKTLVNAELALEKMRQILSESENGPFGTCKGGSPNFDMRKKLGSTLQQMLDALKMLSRGDKGSAGTGGQGSASGTGEGMFGGVPDNGYQSGMNSPLNIPVFGPQRTSFESGHGNGAQGPSGIRIDKNASEKLSRPQAGRSEGKEKGVPYENVPGKYREAVKKYFMQQEE